MRYFLTILMLAFSLVAFGQEENNLELNRDGESSPKIALKIKSIICNLDSISLQKINPEWIGKMEVLKKEEDIGRDRTGTILIYPKRKYYQNILSMLAENEGIDINRQISKQIRKQEFVIKAGRGFDKYEIKHTSLLQIITDFGLSYNFIEKKNYSVYIFEYKNFGLTFYFNDNNSDASLQSIEFRKPFLGITETGIRLGKSTMLDVKEVYGKLDWYSTNGAKYWWSEHAGIEFGVLRDLRLPQYPLDKELHEQKKIIEINVVN